MVVNLQTFTGKQGMTDKLEDISFESVINGTGKSYADWKKSLQPSYRKVAWDIAKGYFFLLAILATAVFLIKTDLFFGLAGFLLTALAIGYTLAYLHLFIHAAAHYNLSASRERNDKLSDLLLGVWFGIPVKPYRKIHWQHHFNLGKKGDTEHSYFNELNLRFIFRTITGMHTLAVILKRKQFKAAGEAMQTPSWFFPYMICVQAALLVLLYFAAGWWMVASWLAGLCVVFPLLATLRQLLEHRSIHASGKINYHETDHGPTNRIFGDTPIDRSFGGAGFNKHMLHHWDPSLSYTNLQEVEIFLGDCSETTEIVAASKTSYFKTFISLFKP